MVPVYFQYMSVSTYGAWLATGNVVTMIGIVESGFGTVITQKMSIVVIEQDNKRFLQLAGANICVSVIFALLLLLIGLIVAPFVASIVNVDQSAKEDITKAFIVSLAAASISIIVSLFGVFAQVWQDTKTSGLISIFFNVIGILSMIYFLHNGFGILSLAFGNLIKAILNLIGILIWFVIKWKEKHLPNPIFKMYVVKSLLSESFHPFLARLSFVLTGNLQNLLIAAFINPTLSAIYDLTSKLTIVLSNFASMVNASFFSLLALTFATKNREKINNIFTISTRIFLIILISALLYSIVFTNWMMYHWVGLEKFGGNLLLVMIIFSVLLAQIKGYLSNILYSAGFIKEASKFDFVSMVLFGCLFFFLIKPTQIYAVPVATIVTGITINGFYLKFLSKKLALNIRNFYTIFLNVVVVILPFLILHYMLDIDLFDLGVFLLYGFVFTLSFIMVIGYKYRMDLKKFSSR